MDYGNQDDFFPPISTYVDISPFITEVQHTCPDTDIRILQMNEAAIV